MAEKKKGGLSGKTLSRPGNAHIAAPSKENDDMALKREQARKLAQEKMRARTLAKQQQIAERISSATEELASAVQEGSSAAEQLGSSMGEISAGILQACGAAEESRVAVSHIEETSENAASLAGETLGQVENTRIALDEMTEGLTALLKGVDACAVASEKTNKVMSELERQSEEIGNIVQAVVRIADQTNLLALNAAIEAARAGEHGRGFAVVADEVRNLAEISEKSAREIKDVVVEIQEAVRTVVTEINSISATTQSESQKGGQIHAGIAKLNTQLQSMRKEAEAISFSANAMVQVSKKFLKGTESLASAGEEVSASADGARKDTEQQNRAFSEMAMAAQDLAEIAEDLKNSTDAQKSAQELASMAEQLSANIEQANSSAHQLAKAIDEINVATKMQSKDAQENAEMANQLLESSHQVNKGAENINAELLKLNASSDEARPLIEALISNVNTVGQDNLSAAENVRVLDAKTRKIEKIVETIMNVTIQTNMLAVSGSIEAARAGEHGRGFSVVSGDIRNLANESAENAEKIKELVRALQAQITKCAQDIDYTARITISESERAQGVIASMARVSENRDHMNAYMEQILTGALEAVTGIEQTSKGIVQIGASAEQIERAVEQASAASEEQAAGMDELAQAIEEIASLADELQSN